MEATRVQKVTQLNGEIEGALISPNAVNGTVEH